jgi:hypothetical protein
MSGALSQNPKLTLIVGLCRELAKLGLNVGMSDARPAAVIRSRVRAPLWITVDDSHAYYEWCDGGTRYPTSDAVEAAVRIADAIKAEGSGTGERQ